MTKEELKTGIILELMDGRIAMVLLGTQNGDIVSGDAWFPLGDYSNDEMFGKEIKSVSVKKVYQPKSNFDYLSEKSLNVSSANLIWERKSKKEMTISEIEKELGYQIKIVKE